MKQSCFPLMKCPLDTLAPKRSLSLSPFKSEEHRGFPAQAPVSLARKGSARHFAMEGSGEEARRARITFQIPVLGGTEREPRATWKNVLCLSSCQREGSDTWALNAVCLELV